MTTDPAVREISAGKLQFGPPPQAVPGFEWCDRCRSSFVGPCKDCLSRLDGAMATRRKAPTCGARR